MEHTDSFGEVMFWIPVAVLLLAIVGLLWAPVAALTCLLAVHFRRLSDESYGAAGAKQSILLVLPWIYLMVRLMFGRSIPTPLVGAVYVLIYAFWLIVYILVFNIGGLLASVLDMLVTRSESLTTMAIFFVALSVMLPGNILTWRSSLRSLRRRYASDKNSACKSPPVVPHGDYMTPFVWLIVWSIVILVITIVGALFGYVGT